MAADTLPLEGWMSKLPHTTKGRSLCELALPGAHNAGANAVECISASTLTDYLGPTLGKTLAQSSIIQALAKPVAQIPALCQTDSVGQLLRKGIRLLDLRLGLHDSDKSEIYICHTVVCSTTFRTVLSELRDFLQQNQEELVVLLIKRDWEHPGFDTPENWLRAQQMLEEELDGMLLSQEDIHRSIGSIVEQRRVVLAMLVWCSAVQQIQVTMCGLNDVERRQIQNSALSNNCASGIASDRCPHMWSPCYKRESEIKLEITRPDCDGVSEGVW